MSQTIEIPNNIPVSWLSRQETSDNDMLLLVSVPDSRTETEFMSKYMKYEDFYGNLRTDMKIGVMQQWVDKLSGEYAAILDNLSSNALCCATIPNPYIISALYQENGNITSLSGYRLSDGMDYLFKNAEFDQISCRNLNASNLTTNNSKITNLSVTTIVNTTIDRLQTSAAYWNQTYSTVNSNTSRWNWSYNTLQENYQKWSKLSVVSKTQLANAQKNPPDDPNLVLFCTDT